VAAKNSIPKNRVDIYACWFFAASIVIICTDLFVFRAALLSSLTLIASFFWAGFAFFSSSAGKGVRAGQRLALGVCIFSVSMILGFTIDKFNEAAARNFASNARKYKSENGVYPTVETAKVWAKPLFGYSQRYSKTGNDSAVVWFGRFNYRLQSLDVATSRLQEERDQ
jgi:hypothetical protein